MMSEGEELTVILVHGTGARLSADEGVAWWQVGSSFHTWLQSQGGSQWKIQPTLFNEWELPPDRTHYVERTRIFRWSGKNSETARRRAGDRLAEVLRRLEESGRPYALIGHSHGGSVIWNALLSWPRSQFRLTNLRGVVTLGAPFLRFEAKLAWLRQLLVLISGLVTIVVLESSWEQFLAQWVDLWDSREYAGLGFALLSMFICASITVSSAYGFVSCSWSGLMERRRRKRSRYLAEALGRRLLCISLPGDEAINGLAVVVPVRNISSSQDTESSRGWIAHLYHKWVTQLTDWILIDRLLHEVAGNDLRGVALVEVTRTPAPDVETTCEYPVESEEPIENVVHNMVSSNWKQLRNDLRQRAESLSKLREVQAIMSSLRYSEFIAHCQYSDDNVVRKRILAHLRGFPFAGTVRNLPSYPLAEPSPESIRWAISLAETACIAVIGFLLLRTSTALLNQSISTVVLQRAPFIDAAESPATQVEYLQSLVISGHEDEAIQLSLEIERPEDRLQAAVGLIKTLAIVKGATISESVGNAVRGELQNAYYDLTSGPHIKSLTEQAEVCRLLAPLRDVWTIGEAQRYLDTKTSDVGHKPSTAIALWCWSQNISPDRAIEPRDLQTAFPSSPIEMYIDSSLLPRSDFYTRDPSEWRTETMEEANNLLSTLLPRVSSRFDQESFDRYQKEKAVSYALYYFDAIDLDAPHLDAMAANLGRFPPEWRISCDYWLARAYSRAGRSDIAMPYLQRLRDELQSQFAHSGGTQTRYPRAALSMELLDLADCFEWLSDKKSASELRNVALRELSKEGLTLDGWIGATLWANQGRIDRAQALLIADTDWSDWGKVYRGLRVLSSCSWASRQEGTMFAPLWKSYFKEANVNSGDSGMSGRLRILEAMLSATKSIRSVSGRSSARKEIALNYLGLGRARYALEIGDECIARDRLEIYSQILLETSGHSDLVRHSSLEL